MIAAESYLSTNNPELPAAYNLLVLDQVKCVRESGSDLAAQDYDEGTIVWVKSQADARARLNKQWLSHDGDLHCAIVLRPEFDPQKYQEILIVAIVSLGNAIAGHVSAMTALGYCWPNDIMIARDKIASVWLDQGISEMGEWLVISASVNISSTTHSQDINAISIHQAEGNKTLTTQMLLESYAREFIKQINNWAERGFDYIFKQWQVRLQSDDNRVELNTRKKVYSGIVKAVTPSAELRLETDDGKVTTISLSDYMELGHG